MKFGAAFIPSMPPNDVVELATFSESAGFDCLWIPDQAFYADPFVLLGLCAQATSRIQIGLAVTNPFTRHPVQIARSAVTVDQVSNGRFLLGIGAGNRTRILPSLGIEPSRVAGKISECIEICRRLFRGEAVTLETDTWRLNEVSLDVTSRPDIPIYVGSRGPKVLELAGRLADGTLMEGLFTPGGLAYGVERIEKGATEAGRSLEDIELIAWQSAFFMENFNDPEFARFQNWAASMILGTQDFVLERIGIPADVVRQVKAGFASGEGARGHLVPADSVSKLLFVGNADQLRERVRFLADTRVDSVSIIAIGSSADVRTTLSKFATDVMLA